MHGVGANAVQFRSVEYGVHETQCLTDAVFARSAASACVYIL